MIILAAALTFPADPKNPFDISPQDFERDLAINTTGNYTAIHEALKGFRQIEGEKPKVFISTGHVLPWRPSPTAVTLGSGAAARAHTINLASQCYREQGFKYSHAIS